MVVGEDGQGSLKDELSGPDGSDDVVAGQDVERGSGAKIKKPRSKRLQMLPPGQGKFLVRQKERQALELRKGGASYQSIADAVGYTNAGGARKAVLRAFGAVIQEPVEELRSLQKERLNHMLLTLWPKVQAGDERAIDTALRVMDKMDRLSGTDAAQQVNVDVTSRNAVLVVEGDKQDYIAALKRMAGVDFDGRNIPRQIERQDIQDAIKDVVNGVVDAEVEEPSVPVVLKRYNFGVDPMTHPGRSDASDRTG